jgi:hypothetical protein
MKLDATIKSKQRDNFKESSKTKRTFESSKSNNKTTIICYKCNKSKHYKRDCKVKEKLKKKQINAINKDYEWLMTENCWLCEKSAETHVNMCTQTENVDSTCDICDDDLKHHNEKCYRAKVKWTTSIEKEHTQQMFSDKTSENKRKLNEIKKSSQVKRESTSFWTHEILHWTECHDDSCQIHLLEKKTEYFSRKKKVHTTRKIIECSDFEDYEEIATSDDEEQDFVKIDSRTDDAAQESRDTTKRLIRKREVYKIIMSKESNDENITQKKENEDSKN